MRVSDCAQLPLIKIDATATTVGFPMFLMLLEATTDKKGRVQRAITDVSIPLLEFVYRPILLSQNFKTDKEHK